LSEPRSYLIKNEKGKILRRNSRWIKKRVYRDLTVTDEGENKNFKESGNVESEKNNESIKKKDIAEEVIKTSKAGRIIKMPKKLNL